MSEEVAAPSTLRRLLAGMGSDGSHLELAEHLDRFGRLDARGFSEQRLLSLVDESGLRGRGGAGFPTATKVRAVAAGRSRPVVVGNGAEGEPASQKDRLLLTAAPHLVLDGIAMVATAMKARRAMICVVRDLPDALESVGRALGERERTDLDEVDISLVQVTGRYVGGEESALVHELNGGPAKPTFVPPRPFERGVDGRPTLILNVETFAQLGLIGRFGADWFRTLGTFEDPGSHLVTLSGSIDAPGVYEVEGGSSLESLVEAGGPTPGSIQAFLVGGYGGTWFTAGELPHLSLGHHDMRAVGGALGPGIVVALPHGACGVAETARIVRFLARESAGQCGPCVFGLDSIAYEMEELAAGVARSDAVDRIRGWSSEIAGRGACSHPDGAVRLVRTCLRVFGPDIDRHADGRPCSPEPQLRNLLPLPYELAGAA